MGTACIVTVTYNSAQQLRTAKWHGDTLDIDWIVVDNASSDDSVSVARQRGATEVIALPRNMGFSIANNVGAALTQADVIIFCNPDVSVTADGLRQLVQHAETCGCIAAPQLLNTDGSQQENGRGVPYLSRKIRHFFGHVDARYCRTVDNRSVRSIPWATGAALAIDRRIFESLRGWDSQFFLYHEDADLCFTAWSRGVPTHLIGAVQWEHRWTRQIKVAGKSASTARRHEIRSLVKFWRKWPGVVLPWHRQRGWLRRLDALQ